MPVQQQPSRGRSLPADGCAVDAGSLATHPSISLPGAALLLLQFNKPFGWLTLFISVSRLGSLLTILVISLLRLPQDRRGGGSSRFSGSAACPHHDFFSSKGGMPLSGHDPLVFCCHGIWWAAARSQRASYPQPHWQVLATQQRAWGVRGCG